MEAATHYGEGCEVPCLPGQNDRKSLRTGDLKIGKNTTTPCIDPSLRPKPKPLFLEIGRKRVPACQDDEGGKTRGERE